MTITKELSMLTSVPEKIFEKLSDNIMFSILQSLQETLSKNEKVCEVDLNIGTLMISLEEDELKFKFIPAKAFEKEILKTVETGQNSMQQVLINNMVSTLQRAYKELL